MNIEGLNIVYVYVLMYNLNIYRYMLKCDEVFCVMIYVYSLEGGVLLVYKFFFLIIV